MADYVKKRLAAFKKISRLEAEVNAFDEKTLDLETIDEFYEQLDTAWVQLEEAHDGAIGETADDAAMEVQMKVFNSMFDDYRKLRLKLRKFAKKLSPVPVNPGASTAINQHVRLPPIELPTFDGSFENWTSFQDLFGAAVGSNSSISDATKLQFLKTALKGKALEKISTLTTTDLNYAEAWKILNTNYNNKREIVHSLITTLINIKPMKSESASEIQGLIDNTSKCLSSLRVLKRPVENWDDILVVLIVSKLDQSTRREWAIRQTGTDLPTLEELITFLQGHIRGLLAMGSSSQFGSREVKKFERGVKVHHVAAGQDNCLICSKSHAHSRCFEFQKKTVSERRDLVKRLRMCFNCLGTNHMSSKCGSKMSCVKCGLRHHTLLHIEPVGEKSRHQSGGNSGVVASSEDQQHKESNTYQQQPFEKLGSHHVDSDDKGLLMTALVNVKDRFGRLQPCRVFIDPGSQGHFITEDCVRRLGLPRQASEVAVSGIGGVRMGKAKGLIETTLFSRFDVGSELPVQLHILSKLTGMLPSVRCRYRNWEHLEGLQLADPQWYNPSPVDIMIGVKTYHKVKLNEKRVGDRDEAPVAWDTIFGWVVSGNCPTDQRSMTSFHVTVEQVHDVVKMFWETEEPPKRKVLTKQEKVCEEHFVNNYIRDCDGRFVVGVPFNERKKELGASREIAIKRWKQVERRLSRQPEFQQQYTEFMKEYLTLGHMERVPAGQPREEIGKTLHLCHHGVFNESSTTTKMRVVFDGSAKTTTNISLNDAINVGATLQDDLYDLLLRFRLHAVVVKADIAKMFRQFGLRDEDKDYHRIVYRESPQDEIQDYRLLTVTYGTACAPNLATRCLQQLAYDCKEEYPEGSAALLNDAYVDDILSGRPSAEEAIKLVHQLNAAVKSAGLELRKWTSNSAAVLQHIPEELRETKPCSFEDDEQLVKALGVQWQPLQDTFTFKSVEFKYSGNVTKRKLYSDLARVFDPLGLVSCVTVRAKLLLQTLWQLSVDWDEKVPEHVQCQWDSYKSDLKYLMDVEIPRQLKLSPEKCELHCFSDSSEIALGTVIYVRSVWPNGTVEVFFVTSKARVAPLKQVSIPRLELNAAKLGAETGTHVKDTLCQTFKYDIVLWMWSDSTITLKWIESEPRRWKTYIANRVAAIQELTPISSWRHVPGIENPADLASRGIPAAELVKNNFWWRGPEWLSGPQLPTFENPKLNVVQHEIMEEKVQSVVACVVETNDWMCRFSSLIKLKRATAYLCRYLRFLKLKKSNLLHLLPKGPLTPDEMQTALIIWIKRTQQQYFGDDIVHLKKHARVKVSSKLKTLCPYLDQHGVLRVTGRLEKATIEESRKHQIILPGESHLVSLLISDCHHRHFHSGFQLTYSLLTSEYWILRGRDRVRFFIRSCVVCRRYRAKAAEQRMGNLPAARIKTNRPFLHVGVDYAGPFTLREQLGRGKKTFKAYICLFVCMSTKALHLERVLSLSTEAFIAALRRFVSRRGLCAHIYSDNGTNFVGADKELRSYIRSRDVNVKVADELSKDGIAWHFNPPAAPHQGGLWEAGVKSVKTHLRRTIGNMTCTDDQFTTLLTEIEAVLNSRPLYQRSSDPADMEALTPGHLLIGGPLTAVPDVDLTDIPVNRLSQYQLIQHQLQLFWRRWSLEYLNTLQQRNKWMWERDNVKVGDLVLIIEESPPSAWKMGRIVEVTNGDDGLVRAAIVKTASTTTKRPIVKLVPLLSDE